MGVVLSIIGIAAFIVFLWWAEKPTCNACRKKIYDKSYLGISAPAGGNLHNRKECSNKWNEMLEGEPYKSQAEEYIKILDRRDAGENVPPEEWKACYRRTR
jgi:hypothetical protein